MLVSLDVHLLTPLVNHLNVAKTYIDNWASLSEPHTSGAACGARLTYLGLALYLCRSNLLLSLLQHITTAPVARATTKPSLFLKTAVFLVLVSVGLGVSLGLYNLLNQTDSR